MHYTQSLPDAVVLPESEGLQLLCRGRELIKAPCPHPDLSQLAQ